MPKMIKLLIAVSLFLSLSSCKGANSSESSSLADAFIAAMGFNNSAGSGNEVKSFPREETLYLVGYQWGDPNSFNPLNSYPSWPSRPEFNLMYEQLTSYNSMTGEIEPLLGRLVEQTNDYVRVIMNPKAKWSDGKPVTAADVKFTFDLNLKNIDAPCSYVSGYLQSVTIDTVTTIVPNADTTLPPTSIREERVTLYVNKEDRNNPYALLDFISNVPIYPKHIFEPLVKDAGSVGEAAKPMMGHPQVISGPYNLVAYSNEKIVVERRDNYWGNEALHGGRLAKPKYIIHPIYKGNEHSSNALKHGELDISSNFMPRIWLKQERTTAKTKSGKDTTIVEGVGTWYDQAPYFKPGAIPMFIINVTRKPLDSKHYRRAMALAIDYGQLKNLAVSGYSDSIHSGLILPFTAESKYYSKEETKKYGATRYDVTAARAELKKGGFKSIFKDTLTDNKGRKSFKNLICVLDAKGDTVPTVFIKCPAGWSDFESIVRLSVKSMRDAGIDVREGFVDASQYWPAQSSGDFDLFMDTPMSKLSASMPWARFEKIMSSKNWKREGEKMYENIGRFNNPDSPDHIAAVDSLLEIIPRMTDQKQITEALSTLNRIFMEEQPALPLLYRPEEFYEFSTKHWTNFPTAANPYAPPHLPTSDVGTKMLWEIKLVKGEK